MGKIYKNVTELIGKTPLVELCHIEKELNLQARVLAKLEYLNPTGSVKDRAALYMIRDAEERGLLKPGGVIIEPTSGNTGIGLASVAASRGYEVILTMPETMSVERRNLLKMYGAKLILTDGTKGMAGAIKQAEELHQSMPGSVLAGQFVNPANVQAHLEMTGPEIWEDTDGQIDLFIAGVGTGGTLTGTGTYLKEKKKEIHIVAVEPKDSPVLSGGIPSGHPLQGIGAGFVPEILNTSVFDEVVTVTGEEAYDMMKRLARKEGILAGITSGAALSVAAAKAAMPENAGKSIVVLLPDSGDRYYSTPVFQNA